jgi:alpha-galactosidase
LNLTRLTACLFLWAAVATAGAQTNIILGLDSTKTGTNIATSQSASAPSGSQTPEESAVILTPKPSAVPRINGAKVFGVRPGSHFMFTIAATGQRPLQFSAQKLPEGLKLDEKTGYITGSITKRGEYKVSLGAQNSLGKAERELKIVCGDQIALTPPMGWNAWNCFGRTVTADKIFAAADAMVAKGLIGHGWTHINIDDCWESTNRNDKGQIDSNEKFPDMKALTDHIHALGLKAGIYSSPGPVTCGHFLGSYQHEDLDAQRYGEWGFDYLKYDYCSYWRLVPKKPSVAEVKKPYEVMRASLNKVQRDIVYSLSVNAKAEEWGAQTGANCWRTTVDITDTWQSLSKIGFSQAGLEKYAGPGHWNDPDMLIVGRVGWSSGLRPTRLTPNEQYTHISLWCLLASPLLIGCDLTQLDEFTLSLLTNDEVLEVNQDPLGRQASRVLKMGDLEVWAKDMEDGSKAVGLFNRSSSQETVTANWTDLGLSGKQTVRDLWRQKDLGPFENQFSAPVPPHGVVLVKISSAEKSKREVVRCHND